jgi:predicted enzyme related to lactoylglutathione lyase
MAGTSENESPVFRDAGMSYLRIPAPDPERSARFYASVFGWTVDTNRQDPSFQDGTGHVIGHFMADLPAAGGAGVRPYIFVERIEETLDRIAAEGGETVTALYPEGNLWVATFRDPGGNEVGVWARR